MTPSVVQAAEQEREAIASEYAEAIRHLVQSEAEEDESVERGTSEYCYPSEYPGAEEAEEEAPLLH